MCENTTQRRRSQLQQKPKYFTISDISEKFTKIVNDKSVTYNFREPILLLRSFQVKKMINITPTKAFKKRV
jgi:hypothetical protein